MIEMLNDSFENMKYIIDTLRVKFEDEHGLLAESTDKVDYLGKYSCYLERKLQKVHAIVGKRFT